MECGVMGQTQTRSVNIRYPINVIYVGHAKVSYEQTKQEGADVRVACTRLQNARGRQTVRTFYRRPTVPFGITYYVRLLTYEWRCVRAHTSVCLSVTNMLCLAFSIIIKYAMSIKYSNKFSKNSLPNILNNSTTNSGNLRCGAF